MSARLKYKPAAYKRLAEIAGWLAAGEDVQWRRTGQAAKDFGGSWTQYNANCEVGAALSYGMEFRIKPKKEPKQ